MTPGEITGTGPGIGSLRRNEDKSRDCALALAERAMRLYVDHAGERVAHREHVDHPDSWVVKPWEIIVGIWSHRQPRLLNRNIWSRPYIEAVLACKRIVGTQECMEKGWTNVTCPWDY